MIIQSGGNSGDSDKDVVEEGHVADDGHDLDATRILPMRAPASSAPGSVIGTSQGSDRDENSPTMVQSGGNSHDSDKDLVAEEHVADDGHNLEATRILPVRAPASSGPGSVIGTSQGSGLDEDETFVVAREIQREADPNFNPVVGWLVILEGPGRGEHCTVYYGQNSIGRGEDQRIQLNFGDARITRDTHAFLVYDDHVRKFYLRDNGKANLIRLNGVAVLAPTDVADRDIISIGETVMLFVALCGTEFDWLGGDGGPNTAIGA
ncbi:MAG: FHA domain-containing protein [Alphaproteobacteria bacterium]|nr:FHA domain-containing protein [Alphaproteobacteria bacterium]